MWTPTDQTCGQGWIGGKNFNNHLKKGNQSQSFYLKTKHEPVQAYSPL